MENKITLKESLFIRGSNTSMNSTDYYEGKTPLFSPRVTKYGKPLYRAEEVKNY